MADDVAEEQAHTGRQLLVIAEIQRIAAMLGVDRLSKSDFDKNHAMVGLSTAGYQFGSWNRAVEAAGLQPNEPGGSHQRPRLSDEELLQEIIRLHVQVGKPPSEHEMSRFGLFSPKPYKARWGSWVSARDVAYAKYGVPEEGAARCIQRGGPPENSRSPLNV